MGIVEKYLLIGVIKWFFRWLASNEKNRQVKYEQTLDMDKVVDKIHLELTHEESHSD